MITEELKIQLQNELPALLRQDKPFRDWLEQLIRQMAVTPETFDARFERVLQELADDRAERRRESEEQKRKWEEQDQKWREWLARSDAEAAENRRKWEEQDQKWREWLARSDAEAAENKRKWEEQDQKWREWLARSDAEAAENKRKWDEQAQNWKEQNQKWWEWSAKFDAEAAENKRESDEQRLVNQRLIEKIDDLQSRQEQRLSAMGARWGMNSEHSFREALKGILEKSFGVQVLNINEFDDDGLVFGRPDQVEIDVIIKNGVVILCELKASMSKGDMYLFDRKAQYYERRHQRPVQRKLVISPMVHPTARPVAEHLGIEVFSYAEDATGL